MDDLLSLSFVTQNPDGSIGIDITSNYQSAITSLERADESGALEDAVVDLTGVHPNSAAIQQLLDLDVTTLPLNSLAEYCYGPPVGPRSSDGSTQAIIGCDPVTGLLDVVDRLIGGHTDAAVSTSIGKAVDTVVATVLPSATDIPAMVRNDAGNIVVDLPQSFADAAHLLAEEDARDLNWALTNTVYSNGDASTVTFTVGGDCLRYASSVGGDTCASQGFAS